MLEMSVHQNLIVFGHLSGLVGVIHLDVSEEFVEDRMIRVLKIQVVIRTIRPDKINPV